MPALSGSEKALMYSLAGVLRAGAGRSGYYSPKTFISVDGTARRTAVRQASLAVTDILNEIPSRASMTVDGFTPVKGDPVIVTLGSINGPRVFTGHALNVTQIYDGKPANLAFQLSCSDKTWLLNSRKVTKRYLSTSVTDIAIDLLQTYAPDFATTGIVSGLDTLDEITFTNEELTDCLSRLVKRIGGYWKFDNEYDLVRLFVADAVGAPQTLTATLPTFRNFQFTEDLSTVITRVNGEGGGANATVPRVAGDTTIPVGDPAWYATAGGTVVSGPQQITYTGKQAGGTGSIVSGSQHAPSAPGAPTAALASPKVTGNLRIGATYLYKITFSAPDGETAGGTASGSISPGYIPDTNASTIIGTPTTGGSLTSSKTYKYAFTFGTALGESNFQGAAATVNTGVSDTRIDLSSIDTSSDARVTKRRIYRCRTDTAPSAGNYASDYHLLTTLNDNSTTTYADVTADASLGSDSPPSSMTATDGEKGSLTSIPTSGDARVTKRLIYRSEDAGTTYKLIGEIPDNSTTTFTDNILAGGDTMPSAATGWAVPVANATLGVMDLAQFTAGGWVLAGGQYIRYTGRSSSSGVGTLTGVPTSGVGSITATLAAGSAVVVAPHLTGIPASGAGSILWPINVDDAVNIYVTRNDATAQTALAAFLGTGDGIREDFIQDHRLSQDEIESRCDALLESRKDARVEITYQTQDVTTQAGATITVSIGSPTSVSGTFKIQQVTIANFQDSPALIPKALPWRTVQASSERFSLEDLLRQRRLT